MQRDDTHMYFGLKWNPFVKDIPVEGMAVTPGVAKFCWRIENLAQDGGYALITGAPGLGKSIALRILEDRLSIIRELHVATILRPQSGLRDFYREIGHHFGVDLSVSNRWGSFRDLRRKWQSYAESTLFRPILLVDEAQEMPADTLNELRFLAAAKFDSRHLLTVILAGDDRMQDKLRHKDLQPLGSRINTRLALEPASVDELIHMMHTCLDKAGNPSLITKDIVKTLANHAAGYPRIMMNMARELLVEAFKQEAKVIDEKIYMAVYDDSHAGRVKRPKRTTDLPPHPTKEI